MASNPSSFSSFTVTSGSLCFGAMHNIWTGAVAPSSEAFPSPPPETSGTVMVHQMEYNIPAENGTWIAYKLVEIGSRHACGWFVCHSETDPVEEIAKILRVSGSPYEEDSGSNFNCESTKAEGVFVINRYDWGYYNTRSAEINEENSGDEDASGDTCEEAGLVDYCQAKTQVRAWKKQKSKKRGKAGAGVWMRIPDGEYMFGRFGFNDERTAARSFLFFTTNTSFVHTTLAGLDTPLKVKETHQERFDRRLTEGYDFSGISSLSNLQTPPADSECFGPYDRTEHIFREQDIECLRLDVCRLLEKKEFGYTVPEFADSWREHSLDVLNELVLSYLEHAVLPKLASQNLATVARGLFPHDRPDVDQPYPDVFDGSYCEGRIREFFCTRSGTASSAAAPYSTVGICQVLVFVIMDSLQKAGRNASYANCNKIVPCDIRMGMLFDDDLGYSRVYWKGRDSD